MRDLSLLSTRVANVKNFPAVHWEYQGSSADNKTVYIVRKMMFAGNSAIDIISSSLGLEVARRNSNDFVGVLEIEDFAPPAVAVARPLKSAALAVPAGWGPPCRACSKFGV